ncbi:MAG: molybdenum cofactor guanylyltransferase [Planctomycetota bacterium]
MMSQVLGVVLAGGASSRMGTDKSMLIHPDGQTLLSRSVEKLRLATDSVVIAGGEHQLAGVPTLPDHESELGPMMGVVTGMTWARDKGFDAILVCAVDYPNIHLASLEAIASQWRRTRVDCVCAQDTHEKMIQPLIAAYSIALLSDFEILLQSRHRSLKRWLSNSNPATVSVPTDQLLNINHPSDWNSLSHMTSSSHS